MFNKPWKSALTVTTLENRDCPSGSGTSTDTSGGVGVLLPPPPPPPPPGDGGIVIIIGPSSTTEGLKLVVDSLYA